MQTQHKPDHDSPYRFEDTMIALSGSRVGSSIGKNIVEDAKVAGIALPTSHKLLGLGVGAGFAERGIAQTLPIAEMHLVDKNQVVGIDLDQFNAKFYKDDLFHFLKSNEGCAIYTIATAFMIDYVLADPSLYESFLHLVNSVLVVGGILSIYPVHLLPWVQFSEFGFKDISDSPDRYLILVKV